jgi:hypothetical protein
MNAQLPKKIFFLIFLIAMALGSAKAIGDYFLNLQLNQQITKLQPSAYISYQEAFINYAFQGEIQNVSLQMPYIEKLTAQTVFLKDLYFLPEQINAVAENIFFQFSKDLFIKANLFLTLQHKNEENQINAQLKSEEWGELKLQTTLKGTGQIVSLEADYKIGKIWQQLMPQLSGWFNQVELLPFPKQIKEPMLTFLKQPKNFKLTFRPVAPMLPMKLVSTPPEQWGLSVSFN